MIKIALAALLAFFIANPAIAGDMYAGMKLGKSRYSMPNTNSTPTGFGIFGGYAFNPDFAMEAGYTDLGNIGGNNVSATDFSALLFYPGNEPFAAYAKLSYASTTWKVPGQAQRNSSFSQGLGFRYDASASINIRFAWDRYFVGNPDVTNVDLYYLAGIYKF